MLSTEHINYKCMYTHIYMYLLSTRAQIQSSRSRDRDPCPPPLDFPAYEFEMVKLCLTPWSAGGPPPPLENFLYPCMQLSLSIHATEPINSPLGLYVSFNLFMAWSKLRALCRQPFCTVQASASWWTAQEGNEVHVPSWSCCHRRITDFCGYRYL